MLPYIAYMDPMGYIYIYITIYIDIAIDTEHGYMMIQGENITHASASYVFLF